LIVNADAVLALAVAMQRLKTIAGQCGQVSQRRGCLKTVELQPRGPVKTRERLDPFSSGEVLGPLSR
jgi:hypothetical protein